MMKSETIKSETMKSEAWIRGVSGAVMLIILVAGSLLFTRGPLGDYVKRPESLMMFWELGVFFLWNVFWLSQRKAWVRSAGVLASFVIFLWLHQAIVPIVVSGLYLAVIIKLGSLIRKPLCHCKDDRIAALLLDFQVGYTVWLMLVCVCSVLSIGSIRQLRLLFLGLSAVGGLHGLYELRKNGTIRMPQLLPAWKGKEDDWRERSGLAVLASLFLSAWMIQIGRMNIAMDYDSLHYGLRSAYILNNGNGIYDNLGNINLVYTYSKGLEVLGLPLAGTATYGYTLALNLWITVLVFAVIYLLAGALAGKRAGWLAVFLSAGVPALMNMSITAKSDNLTLLFQLICMYGCMQCAGITYTPESAAVIRLQSRDSTNRNLWLPASAYLLTLTLKPTAIVFSTVLFGVGLLFLIRQKRKNIVSYLPLRSSGLAFFLLSGISLLGIWGRTLLLTGVPVTSVFTGIFEKMGFQVKEPFAFMSMPSNGTALSLGGAIRHVMQRLFGILLAPAGEDMAHVIIAWGGGIITFLLVICIVCGVFSGTRKARSYITGMTAAVGLVSLVSLYLLWQVDGNYYLLFYALVVLLAVRTVEKNMQMMVFLVPLFCFQLLIMSLTNWGGAIGMTPVKIRHAGWYNHQEANYEEMGKIGSQQIWNCLAANPQTRVIAFGEHPQILCFPCNVQSYYDVTGSGGNVWLVKKLDYFKSFLAYADTEYIYAQAGYLEEGSRAEEIIRFMIEEGSLQNIVYENGNLLGTVVLAPEQAQSGERTPAEELSRYYELYGR